MNATTPKFISSLLIKLIVDTSSFLIHVSLYSFLLGTAHVTKMTHRDSLHLNLPLTDLDLN
jgi:hypothetical protein